MNTFSPLTKSGNLLVGSEIASEINCSLSHIADKYNELLQNDEPYKFICSQWQDGLLSHLKFLSALIQVSVENSNVAEYILTNE